MIHVARNQQTLGSFSEDEVREGIRTGRFTDSDLAWRAGMETWQPLGKMASQWNLELPPALTASNDDPAASSASDILSDGSEPAWEQREKLGFFPALTQTVSAVLMRPTPTFAGMKHEGGLTDPLVYFVLLSCVTYAVSVLYQIASFSMESGSLPEQLQHYSKNAVGFTMIGTILISPALYVIGAFLSSGITHLCLKLLGGAHRPFETTFRVICYAQASASIFNLLPLCGGLMSILWGSYTIIIGLKEAHGISAWKSTLAITLPGLLCCGIFLACGAAAGVSLAELGKLGK
jgi:hypothetical protein